MTNRQQQGETVTERQQGAQEGTPAHQQGTTTDDRDRRTIQHEVKIWPSGFGAILDGTMRHQTRINDRDYRLGDGILLLEYIPGVGERLAPAEDANEPTTGVEEGRYTGRQWRGRIGHVTRGPGFGLPKNLCTFSIFERFL